MKAVGKVVKQGDGGLFPDSLREMALALGLPPISFS